MKKIYIIFALLLVLMQSHAQNDATIITGKVTAADNGEQLMGVSVAELDDANRLVSGAMTDMNGEFSLRIKNVKNKIRISYIGYHPEIVSINGKKRLDIKLKDNTHEITETVVTAKRTTNDGAFNVNAREVSMAMQKIDAKDFEGLSVASVDDALQGRVSGLDIVGNSGAPGSGMTMRIRGTSSITGNAQPLIVVNGIPFDGDIKSGFDFASANEEQYASLLNVNVDDIQEITVLKDAASTAVWGSRGANGVLMITTKKGIKGKTKVQYSYRYTQATQPQGMKMLNGDDYTMLMKQEMFNKTLATNETRTIVPEFNYDPSFSEYQNFNNNTDWVAAVTQTGRTNDHYLTVSGGGDRAKFRISGGYYDQTGTNIGQELKRFSTRSQLDYQVSDRLRFISEFSYTYTDNSQNYANLLDIAYKKMPNVSIYSQDAAGNNTSAFYNIRSDSKIDASQRNLMNPVALGRLALNKEKSYLVIPTFRLSYDFFDPDKTYLRYNAYVSFELNNVVDNDFLPYNVNTTTWSSSSSNKATGDNTERLTVNTENTLTWIMPKDDKHALMLYAGLQTSSAVKTVQSFATSGLPDAQITDPTGVGFLESVSSSTSKAKSIGLISRAHYSFLNRYILDLTCRVDGSSKFGQNNQFGAFPGVGAKWIVSDESFMKPTNEWLSLLAFRPSWGIAGNQPRDEYLQYSRYVSDNLGYLNSPSIHPSNLQLSNLRWEKVTSTNLGADLELFKGKVSFVFDWYHKRTDDLLFTNLAISPTSGYTTVTNRNVGKMDNDGWEINVDFKDVVKAGKFSMDVNMNISNYYNKIIELDDAVTSQYNNNASYIDNGTYLTRLQTNNSFGSIYGFKYKGVYQYSNYIAGSQEDAPVARDANGTVLLDYNGNAKPMYYNYKSTKYAFKGGDVKYEDINHDGSIDQYDVVYLGNSNPKFSGGFGINFRYENFSLRSLFTYRYGNKIINYARMTAENMYSNDNQTVTTNWRWRKEGDITMVPRAVYQQGYNWLPSDRYVEDGSFLRLKYIQLSYSVPTKMIKKLKLNQVNLYCNLNNLFTLTNYSGVDPEISVGGFATGQIPGVAKDVSKTPRSKDWNLGITVGF
jgi:TonB-linked SusC/RagA family outer membrane protein